MNEILGVDIGNVIIDRSNDSDQKFFSEQYLEVPPIAGVFEALRKLVELRFGERVFLVSRVSREELAEINKGWLLHHDFYGKTGVKQDRVIFCAGRHKNSH